MSDVQNEAAESTREAKTVREYIDANGDSHKRPPADVVAVALTFKPTGEKIRARLSDLPESMRNQLAAWGWMTNVGNTLGKKGTETAQAAADRAELFANGEWAEAAGEGGPSPTMLATAAFHAGQAAGQTKMTDGQDFTLENVILKFKSFDAEMRKKIKSVPEIALEYAKLEQEKIKQRIAEQKKAIKEASSDLSGIF